MESGIFFWKIVVVGNGDFFSQEFFFFPKWLGVFARKAFQSFALWKNFRFLSLVETIPVVALIKGPFGDVGLLVGCDRRKKKG